MKTLSKTIQTYYCRFHKFFYWNVSNLKFVLGGIFWDHDNQVAPNRVKVALKLLTPPLRGVRGGVSFFLNIFWSMYRTFIILFPAQRKTLKTPSTYLEHDHKANRKIFRDFWKKSFASKWRFHQNTGEQSSSPPEGGKPARFTETFNQDFPIVYIIPVWMKVFLRPTNHCFFFDEIISFRLKFYLIDFIFNRHIEHTVL